MQIDLDEYLYDKHPLNTLIKYLLKLFSGKTPKIYSRKFVVVTILGVISKCSINNFLQLFSAFYVHVFMHLIRNCPNKISTLSVSSIDIKYYRLGILNVQCVSACCRNLVSEKNLVILLAIVNVYFFTLPFNIQIICSS